jgi:hypothetical protein
MKIKGSHVVTLALIAGIALLISWIARNTYWEEVTVPMPMRGEALTNSTYALQRLAGRLGVIVEAPPRFEQLPDTGTVIYLSYWNWDLLASRREQLQRWVEAGGHLVADGSLIGGERELRSWTGIERSVIKVEHGAIAASEENDEDDCLEVQAETIAPDPYTSSTSYYLCGMYLHSRLESSRRPSWLLADESGMQALRIDLGQGSFTLINGTPFGNFELFEGDNSLLFAATTRLDRGTRLMILSEEESASLLELMWTYGAPVILLSLGLIAMALWRGSPRFGPPAAEPEPARRSLAEQIIGTGRFALRFGGGCALHAAAVRALHETAQRHLSGYSSMHGEDRIAALAKRTGMDRDSLTEAINYTGPRSAGELRKVITLLETARRRIS